MRISVGLFVFVAVLTFGYLAAQPIELKTETPVQYYGGISGEAVK